MFFFGFAILKIEDLLSGNWRSLCLTSFSLYRAANAWNFSNEDLSILYKEAYSASEFLYVSGKSFLTGTVFYLSVL